MSFKFGVKLRCGYSKKGTSRFKLSDGVTGSDYERQEEWLFRRAFQRRTVKIEVSRSMLFSAVFTSFIILSDERTL